MREDNETTAFPSFTLIASSRLLSNLDNAMVSLWHKRPDCSDCDPCTGFSHLPFVKWMQQDQLTKNPGSAEFYSMASAKIAAWRTICACCGKTKNEIKLMCCSRCRTFFYCSKECQKNHWRAGHKSDCNGHWIEAFFPKIRKPEIDSSMIHNMIWFQE